MAQWKEITTTEQWEQVLEGSKTRPAVVLKHSTQCPVSSNALDEYDAYLEDETKDNIDFYMVKVIESRPVSNRIAEDSGVKHASPQIIMFKNKEAEWNASHWAITYEHITAVLK